MDPICSETLINYMTKLTEIVERTIEQKLPSNFSLIFYSCYIGSYYYEEVLAYYSTKAAHGYARDLLSFSVI